MANDFTKAAGSELASEMEFRFQAERQAHSGTKQELQETQETARRLEREFGFLSSVGARRQPPKWVSSPRQAKSKHYSTPNLMLSDLHLDEVVDPQQVMGVNSYNRHIAQLRLRHTMESVIKMCRDYSTGTEYPGFILNMGGDIFSGDIHEELKETNEGPLMEGFKFWLDPMAEAFDFLASEFGKLHVNVVVGNHGRTTRKPRAKGRVYSNFDWLFGVVLQKMFANDQRITFDIATGADMIYDCYGYTTMLTHGDQARGGSGWGGIASPIGRLMDKKTKRQAAVKTPFDYMVMGHWHQLMMFPRVLINGSMKGYDEYAFVENFEYEPPQQALWFMTPEHGRTELVPIFCEADDEGWRKAA